MQVFLQNLTSRIALFDQRIKKGKECGDLYQILEWWTGISDTCMHLSEVIDCNRCVKQEARGP